MADRKASLLLTAHVAYLGLMANAKNSNWQGATVDFKLFSSAVVLSAAFAGIFEAKAVYPKTLQRLILWESIVQRSSEEYRREIRGKSGESLLRELIDKNYKLAEVADGKYDDVRNALWCTGVTVISTLIAISQLPTL